ncbi:hypothetical protein BEP19_05845 [Ammoniphilus oxalaticus]|uniref:Uncharacterized protein n=1 Tax=Ammoniphilus oxalaticus TaxID=66863 RepID=A0A419SIT4_9BACL|nr:DUF1292 domain-containing protein [Ammoniphilus oxalaticus]RKD23944.1 hypothetical protein BEP19_05845 [Ammoniphilus oxalaticus]
MDEELVGQVVTLADDETGEERDFEVMYMFDIEGRTYLCLVPDDQREQEEVEVHFLRLDKSDGMLYPIESEEEQENVIATFETLEAEFES